MTLEEKKARIVELKAKLEELKAARQVKASKAGLEGAAARMMVDDPIAAFGLLDKSRELDIKEQQAGRSTSPDAARQQLRISRDTAIQTVNNQTLGKTERDLAAAEARVYIEEMSKPNPSTQAAAERVSALYGNALAPTPKVTGDPKADMEAKIKDEIGKIRYKGKELDEKVAALNLAIDNAGLESGQKTSLKKYLSDLAATKPAPPATDDAKASKWVTEYLAVLDPKAFAAQASKARAALTKAMNEFKLGNYATANLQVFKETMGAMSAGEYGIAANSKIAAVVSSLPVFGDAMASAIAVDKFNNKEEAAKRIGEAVRSWNDLIDQYTPENMYDPGSGLPKDAVAKAIRQSPKFSAMKNSLGGKLSGPTSNKDLNDGNDLIQDPSKVFTDKKGRKYTVNGRNERVYQ